MDYIFFLACHDKFTCCENNLIIIFFPDFVDKNVLTPFKHDVHVCVFTVMYMFVNYICKRYINVSIHQRLNPRHHGTTLKF